MGSFRKIAIGVGALVVVILAAGVYVALWEGSTKDIEAVADKFQPGESWTLVSEDIEPPRYLCLGGRTCPELLRTWSSDKPLTAEELHNIASRSGVSLQTEGDCSLSQNASGSRSLCHAEGKSDEYYIYLDYSTANANVSPPNLSLLVRERNLE